MQVVDPWTSGNAFETPSVGQRFVAVELTITNTTDEMQTFSTLLGLEVRDASGQRWNAGLYGLDLPQLGGDIPPGGLMRGWQVFEVGDGGGALQLVVKGSLTATPTLTRPRRQAGRPGRGAGQIVVDLALWSAPEANCHVLVLTRTSVEEDDEHP